MKSLLTKQNALCGLVLALVISAVATGCVYLTGYDILQEHDGQRGAWCYAGENVKFTVNGYIECQSTTNSTNFVFAMLVPKSWNAAQSARVTYCCDLADDRDEEMSMSLIPSSNLPKNGQGRTWTECLDQEFGVGTNVLDDMEWIVFQTDLAWDISSGQKPNYTIYVRMKAGKENMKFHPAFFVNHTDDGFSTDERHKKVIYASECFEVVGGSGLVLDFCNNHYNKVSPMASLQDDYITFSYLGYVADNELNNYDEIYFEATATTDTGKKYSVTKKDAETLMRREDALSKIFTITIWPTGFFGIPEGEVIENISYSFTNKDGSVKITQSDDDKEQLDEPLPSEKVPFSFQFLCN